MEVPLPCRCGERTPEEINQIMEQNILKWLGRKQEEREAIMRASALRYDVTGRLIAEKKK